MLQLHAKICHRLRQAQPPVLEDGAEHARPAKSRYLAGDAKQPELTPGEEAQLMKAQPQDVPAPALKFAMAVRPPPETLPILRTARRSRYALMTNITENWADSASLRGCPHAFERAMSKNLDI